MKRVIIALMMALIFPAISFGADATITLVVNGTDLIPNPTPTTLYQEATEEYDEDTGEYVEIPEVKGEASFPAISGTNYTFSTVENALDFAKNPQVYIQGHTEYIENMTDSNGYPIEEPYYDVQYDTTLQSTIATVTINIITGTIDYAVDLSNYTMITTITFTATPRTITAPSGERHFIVAGQDVTFSNITFNGNSEGGGVEVNGGTVTFTGCAFNDCDMTSGGGLLLNSGTATFTGTTTFTNCEASDNGGGILVAGGQATFTGTTTFTGCSAGNYGGAIAVTVAGSSAIFSGTTTFSSNNADQGGAVALRSGSMYLANASFTNNTATYGGAVFSSGSLNVGAGVTFNSESDTSPNTATNGGAIYISGGTTTLSGSQTGFTSNTADEGGAIYVNSGTLNVTGTGVTFTANTASTNGGAIWAGSNTTVKLDGADMSFTNNSALSGDGGALYASGSSTVQVNGTAPVFSENSASDSNGGAVYMAGGSTLTLNSAATFAKNKAMYGGGIFMANARNATNLNITGTDGVSFEENEADISGGAIYAEANCNITCTPELTFTSNQALNGNGGAIWIADALQLPEGTVYFEQNKAGKNLPATPSPSVEWPDGGNGGAIYSQTSSNAVVGLTRDYQFTATNEAQYHGGALCTYSGDITIQGYVLSRSITVNNTAALGGGLAASYEGTVTVNNSSIMNQSATNGSGGAIWSKNVTVNSADFGSETLPNTSRGSSNTGGGAIYIHTSGTANLNNATFSYNTAYQGGGAVYANAANVTIRNSYFHHNTAQNGNGGAVILRNYCTTSIVSSTFQQNKSEYLDGGAVFSQGTISINLSSFSGNTAFMDGGAIYYDQAQNDNASFTISSSMLEENSTLGGDSGGSGGALYIAAVRATIMSCTFSKNRIDLSGNEGEGGAVYLNTAAYQTSANRIENCTFYGNVLNDGAATDEDTMTIKSGGGGISVHCEGLTRIVSCTFTENAARYGGGAIYVAEGNVNLSGTLAVGNATGICDIWSDGNIVSGGYNRIGVYGTGSGVTNFYAEARNDTDRTSYPSKGWSRTTFFSDNVLAVNERTDLGDNIPPYLGSTRAGQERLLTLMLKEEETLPLIDRATNIIPYSRRQSFPNTDARGVNRVSDSGEINLDIGACFFDGTRYSDSEEVIASYTISRVEISGIPNNLRRVGQTASLIAKVYYTNGRSALGGTGTGEEPVEWTSDKPNIIRINKDTGDITVLSFTPGETYVTITASTIRTDDNGVRVSDSKVIKVTEYTYSYLNTTSALIDYLQGYTEQLTEYDISLQLADVSSSAVSASTFQSSFAGIWGNTASQVTDIADGALTFDTVKSYTASDGYNLPGGKAGVNVRFSGLNEGDVFPLIYSWTFSGNELSAILGYNLADKEIDGTVADEMFTAMRIDFTSNGYERPVIGTGGVKASDAMKAGALTLTKSDSGKGLHAELTAYLANVTASGTNDGPQIVSNLLVVPDGNGKDGAITGAMMMAGKPGSASVDTGSGNTTETGNTTQSSSSGGGGCAAFGMFLMVPILIVKRKQ